MKFLPGPRENTAVIEPESFEAPIRVDGISPEVMAGLFRGSNAARSHWHPPLEITAGLTGADDVATGEPYEKDLPDGRGILHTGAPGSVRIETHHRLAGDLQPRGRARLDEDEVLLELHHHLKLLPLCTRVLELLLHDLTLFCKQKFTGRNI